MDLHRTCVLLVLCLLLMPADGYADDPDPSAAFFDHIDRRDGLPSNSISSMVQDRDGFLWFGTQGGLVRFDGRHMIEYRHTPFDADGLPHDLVQTMYLDPVDPVLWLGTYGGLSRFDLVTSEFTNYSDTGPSSQRITNNVVTAIVRDSRGDIWIGTLDGLNRLDPESGAVQRFLGPQLPDATVRALHVDDQGRMWIGTYGGLAVLSPQSGRVESVLDEEDLGSPFVMSITEGVEDHELVLSVWGQGLVRYNTESGELVSIELEDERIYTAVVDPDGAIYAASWGGGLFRHHTGTGTTVRFEARPGGFAALQHNTVYSLLRTSSGALWVGTNGGGVHRFSETRRNYLRYSHDPNDPDSLSAGEVTSMLRDSRGRMWVGTYNGGLNLLGPEGITRYTSDSEPDYRISNDIITAIYEDVTGVLWVATNEGLNRYLEDEGRFEVIYGSRENHLGLTNDIIYGLEDDARGHFWIGSHAHGLTRLHRETGETVQYRYDPDDPSSLSDNLIYDIDTLSNGELWIATNRGLNRYDYETDSFIRYLHDPEDPNSIGSASVRALFEDSRGRLWVATASGGLQLYRRAGDDFRHYFTDQGLPSNTVVGINEDDEGRIWIATTNGLGIVDPETDEVARLDEEEGIGGLEFSSDVFRDTDGSLWFGGTHGITVIDDNPLIAEDVDAPIHITQASVSGREVPREGQHFNDKRIRMAWQDKLIDLEFASLNYAAPENTAYRYRLEGFSNEWIEAGNRNFVSFTSLPPGSYTFRVQARRTIGEWQDSEARVYIDVDRPPYLQWWAFLLYLCLAAGMSATVIRLREGRLLKRLVRELSEERSLLRSDNQRLGLLSLQDPMTSIANRRYFQEHLNYLTERLSERGGRLVMLMVDIDNFKNYNDYYGHPEGDHALRRVAHTLRDAIRGPDDLVSRYGGEEFAILLNDVDLSTAMHVAERLRTAIEALAIPHDRSAVSTVLTVSIGVCSVGPESSGGIISGADRALYDAKRRGRNRTEHC